MHQKELQRLEQREQKKWLCMMNRNGTCPPVGANMQQALKSWLGFGVIIGGEGTEIIIRQENGNLRWAIFIFIASDVVVIV